MSKIQVNNGRLYIPYDYSTDKVIIGVKDSSGKLVAAKTVIPVRDALPSLNIQITPVKDNIVYLDGNYGVKNTLIFDINYTLNGKTIYNSDVEYKTLDSNYEISVISPTQIEIAVKTVSNYVKSKISDKNTYSNNIPFSLTYNGCEYEFNIGITFNKTSYQFTSMYDTIYISNRTGNNSSNNSLIDINGYFNNVPIDKDEMTLTLSDDFSNIAKSLKMVSLDKSNNDWFFNYNLNSSNSVYNTDDFVVDKSNNIYDIRNKFNAIDTNNNVYFKDGTKVIDVSGNIYHNNIKIFDNSTNAIMQNSSTSYISIDSSNNIYYKSSTYKVIDNNGNICWKTKKDVSAITNGNVINRIDTSTKIIDNNNNVYLSNGNDPIYKGTDIYGDSSIKIADKNKKILGYSGYYLDSYGDIYNNSNNLYLDSSVVSVGDYSLNVYDKVIKKSTRTYYDYKTDTFYINGGSSYKLVNGVVEDSRNNTIINSSLVLTDSSFKYDISNGSLTYNGNNILNSCNNKNDVSIANGNSSYYTITSGLSGLSVCFKGTSQKMISGDNIFYKDASGKYSSFTTTSKITLYRNYYYNVSDNKIYFNNNGTLYPIYDVSNNTTTSYTSLYLTNSNNTYISKSDSKIIFKVNTTVIDIYLNGDETKKIINRSTSGAIYVWLYEYGNTVQYDIKKKIIISYNGTTIVDCSTKRCNLSNNYYFDYVNKKIYYSTSTTPIATLYDSSIEFGYAILNYDTNGNASASIFNDALKIKDKKLEVVNGTYYYSFDTKKIVDNSSNTFIDSNKDIYAINGKIFDGSSLYIAGGSKLLDVDDKIFYCVKNLYTYDIDNSKILYNSSDYVTFNSNGIDLNYVKVTIKDSFITYKIDNNTSIEKNTSNSTITYKIDTNTSIEKNTSNSTITYKMSDSSIVKIGSSIIYKMGDSFIEKNTSNNNFTYTKNDKTNGKLDIIKNTSQNSYSYKLNDSTYLTYNISNGNIYGSNPSTIITNSTKKDRPIYYFDSSYKLSFDNKEVSAIEDSSILYDTSGNIAIIANDTRNESYTTDGFNTPVLNKELILDKYNNIKIREGVSYNLKDNTCRDDRNSIIDETITNFNVILKVADSSFLYDSNNRAVFDITYTRVLLDDGMYCTSNGTIYNSDGSTLVSGTTISNNSNGAITKDSSKIYYKGVLLKDNSNNIYYRGKKVYNSSSKVIYDKNEITTITDIDNLYISIDSSYMYYYKEKTIKDTSKNVVVDANNKIHNNSSNFRLDNDNVYYNGLLVKDNKGNVYKKVIASINTSNNTLTVNGVNVKYLYEKVGNTYKIYNVYGESVQCSLISCDSYYNIHSLNNINSKGISDILTLFKKYEYVKGANNINIKVNVNYNFDNIAAKDLLLVNGENNISNYRIVATPQVLTTETVKDSTITAYVANKNGDIVPNDKIEEEGFSLRYSIDGATDVYVSEDTVNISNVSIYNNVKFRLYKNGKIVSEEIVDVIGDVKYITSVEYVNVTKSVSNYSIEPKNSSIYGDTITWSLNSSDGGKVYYDANGLDISAGYSKNIVLNGKCNGVKVYEKTIVPTKDGKDGSTGATGSKGDRGLVVYPAGVYDSSTKYVISNNTTPYVEYNGMYYVLIKSNTTTGQTPANATYWTSMEKYKAIYTEMMIADGGTLGGAVFDGNGAYMFSKSGKDASGENSSTYQNFSTNTIGDNIYDKVNTSFKPSMLFNFESGKGYMDNGNIIFDDGILLKDNALIQTYDELTTRDKFESDTFYDNIQFPNNAIIFTDVEFKKSLGVEKLNSIISIDGTKFSDVNGANTLILILTKECGNLPKDKYVKGSVIFTNGTLSNIVYINNGNFAKISDNTSREIKFLFKWNGTEKRYSITDNNKNIIKTITALNGNYIFY